MLNLLIYLPATLIVLFLAALLFFALMVGLSMKALVNEDFDQIP